MREKITYVAADGKEFQDRENCERYEDHLKKEKALLSQIRVWDESGEPIHFKDVEGLERAVDRGTVVDFQTDQSADFLCNIDGFATYFSTWPTAGRYYYDAANNGFTLLDDILETFEMYAEL